MTRIRSGMGKPPSVTQSRTSGSRATGALLAVTTVAVIACLLQGADLLAVLVAVPAVALVIGDR